MLSAQAIAAIHKCVTNPIPPNIPEENFAGIIGDGPSQYSKSPPLWNEAFRSLGMSALYLPFDVDDAHVGELLTVLRDCQGLMGVNVTVPHKQRVLDFLDELDPGAARIQAVNTIVKSADGTLIGYNTDGEGFIESILNRQPGESENFLPALADTDVLLLGAGGSARAVAFQVCDYIGKARLIIANRTLEHAAALAGELQKLGRHVIAIDEDGVADWAPKVGLIVNSTTKGQGGIRKLNNGLATQLVPYSALAPAHPPVLPFGQTANLDFESVWFAAAQSDVDTNNRLSLELTKSIPRSTRFYDLVYHPEQTVFLRHGRATGHKTMNGKNMIVCQAVIAFCQRVCQGQLAKLGKDDTATYQHVAEIMYRAW